MSIIIVDNESSSIDFLERLLTNYPTVSFANPLYAFDYCKEQDFDILLVDQKMPKLSGIDLVRKLKQKKEGFFSIVISAETEVENLIEAVNSNLIYKYIVKPFHPDYLLQHIHRAYEALELARQNEKLAIQLNHLNRELKRENKKLCSFSTSSLDAFIGYDSSIQKIKRLVPLYAQSDKPLLILGETGTGKELIARAAHEYSNRKNKRFMVINCSAFSNDLLESELFGYEAGAFTGAHRRKEGLLKAADGGTLFLDEIGDMPHHAQAKILRFIQFGTFIPIGTTNDEHVDVRIIAATNKNIEKEIKSGHFRQDLYYRLSILIIHIPPLREHKDDIPYIMEALALRHGFTLPAFREDALQIIQRHSFPGNVRELEAILHKLYLHAAARTVKEIDKSFLNQSIEHSLLDFIENENIKNSNTARGKDGVNGNLSFPINLHSYLESIEKQIITRCLHSNKYVLTKTAADLGLSRQGLRNKLRRYNIILSKTVE